MSDSITTLRPVRPSRWLGEFLQHAALPAVVALAGAAAAGPALAQSSTTPKMSVTASTVAPLVTYSRSGLPTYAAWSITLTNISGNTINNISATVATAVGTTALPVVFVYADGAACGPQASDGTVPCSIGSFVAGQAQTFLVYFQTPALTPTTPSSDAINLSATVNYGEGTNDSTGASHPDQVVATSQAALGTVVYDNIKTVVPKKIGTQTVLAMVTGSGVATPSDPWTTTVSLPLLDSYGTLTAQTASIDEFPRNDGSEPVTGSCSPYANGCRVTQLYIPGYSATTSAQGYIQITLRRDASTIVNPTGGGKAKITDLYLCYFKDGTTGTQNCDASSPNRVPMCSDVGGAPSPGQPCIWSRKIYKNNEGPTRDYDGDAEYIIRARDNGRYQG